MHDLIAQVSDADRRRRDPRTHHNANHLTVEVATTLHALAATWTHQ